MHDCKMCSIMCAVTFGDYSKDCVDICHACCLYTRSRCFVGGSLKPSSGEDQIPAQHAAMGVFDLSIFCEPDGKLSSATFHHTTLLSKISCPHITRPSHGMTWHHVNPQAQISHAELQSRRYPGRSVPLRYDRDILLRRRACSTCSS